MHKKNGGVGSSRNAGLEMATGEYVLFVDHDDLLSETHIEEKRAYGI
ncbi:glycosyltransferase family A protein [Lactobacillus taiwanensis]